MRSISSATMRDMLQANPALVYVVLIKINHARLTEPIYLCDNTADITSSVIDANKKHLAFPFEFTMAPASAQKPIAAANIVFTNVDKRLVDIARAVTDEPDFWFALVASSNWHEAVVPTIKLKMAGVRWTPAEVRAELRPIDLLAVNFPPVSWTPPVAPGLHG